VADTHVTSTGNLTDDPDLKVLANGSAVVNFRLAVTARVRDGDTWRDGDTSYFRVNAWRQLAEHTADSLGKGDRAVGHRPAPLPQLGDARGRQALGRRGRSRRGRPVVALGDRPARTRQRQRRQDPARPVHRRARLLTLRSSEAGVAVPVAASRTTTHRRPDAPRTLPHPHPAGPGVAPAGRPLGRRLPRLRLPPWPAPAPSPAARRGRRRACPICQQVAR
jgi:hypothetical protein